MRVHRNVNLVGMSLLVCPFSCLPTKKTFRWYRIGNMWYWSITISQM